MTVAGGHTAITDGPQTGKTTLLRTLALSLSLTQTPCEVAVYGLDLVDGGLSALTERPTGHAPVTPVISRQRVDRSQTHQAMDAC